MSKKIKDITDEKVKKVDTAKLGQSLKEKAKQLSKNEIVKK